MAAVFSEKQLCAVFWEGTLKLAHAFSGLHLLCVFFFPSAECILLFHNKHLQLQQFLSPRKSLTLKQNASDMKETSENKIQLCSPGWLRANPPISSISNAEITGRCYHAWLLIYTSLKDSTLLLKVKNRVGMPNPSWELF